MRKIELRELERMLADVTTPDRILRRYLIPAEHEGSALRPRLAPNPDLVIGGASDHQRGVSPDSALAIGNDWSRWRRQRKFMRRRARGDRSPIIVAEGDSWHQFPILVDDIVDHLDPDFLVWSLDEAGDDAQNMIRRDGEYLDALIEHVDDVQAFLFSGAGNDVIGEDAAGRPSIASLLRRQEAPNQPADALIDHAALGQVIGALAGHYRALIRSIRAEPRLERLPILFHGYDYPFPYEHSSLDRRRPFWARRDEWLGAPMAAKSIHDPGTRRGVCRLLIDALYDMLTDVAAEDDHVHVVDLRGLAPNIDDWVDEIHPTSIAFGRMAQRVRDVLNTTIEARPAPVAGYSQPRLDPTDITIVLDPGHGGDADIGGSSWSNAVGPLGTLEKDVTLAIGLAAETALEMRGYRVLKTREVDVNKSVHSRAKLSRNSAADVFLSIHLNGSRSPGIQGTEAYHHRDANAASRQFAHFVQRATRAATRLSDRGVKSADLTVLRPDRHDPGAAAAMLEVCFLTDPEEEARLASAAYIENIAEAIADGVEDYLEARARAFLPDLEPAWGEPVTAPWGGKPREDAVGGADSANAQEDGPALFADRFANALQSEAAPGFGDVAQFRSGWSEIIRSEAPAVLTLEGLPDGRDDSVEFRFAAQATKCGRAVAKILPGRAGVQGGDIGTGFLIAPNILLTNNHILPTVEDARDGEAVFGFSRDANGRVGKETRYRLNPDRLFLSSPAGSSTEGLDYSFVWVDGAPHEDWGHIVFERGSFLDGPTASANLIHHPDGDLKKISLRENRIVKFKFAPYLLHYTSDTRSGSSGSPVFSDEWRLIALHHAERSVVFDEVFLPTGVRASTLNEGVRMSAIAADIEARAFEVSDPESRSADEVLAHVVGVDSRLGYFGAAGRASGTASNSSFQRVALAYSGGRDIDIGYWAIPDAHRTYTRKMDDMVRVFADIRPDVWVLDGLSPRAARALARRYETQFGDELGVIAANPSSVRTDGLPATMVFWNPLTVDCGASDRGLTGDGRFRLSTQDRAVSIDLLVVQGRADDRDVSAPEDLSDVLVIGPDAEGVDGFSGFASARVGPVSPPAGPPGTAPDARQVAAGFAFFRPAASRVHSIHYGEGLAALDDPDGVLVAPRSRVNWDAADRVAPKRPTLARLCLNDLSPPGLSGSASDVAKIGGWPPGHPTTGVSPGPGDATVGRYAHDHKPATFRHTETGQFENDQDSIVRRLSAMIEG